MGKIDLRAYENGFKPKFNQAKYDELMRNTPTRFKCGDKVINIRKELVKTLIIGCSHLNQKVDENHILTGDEGSGKSHYSFQLAFVKHRILTELGMIAYPFTLDLIYFNVQQIIEAFDNYANIPYMIYVLDESDSLTRNKWNDPTVKKYISKLRRERKNLRVVFMNMPQLSELLPTVTLTRVTLIFEIKIKTESDKLKRGQYNIFCIPRGNASFSTYHNTFIDKTKIKNIIAKKLYATEERYFNLPREILMFQGRFNGVSPIDSNEYLKRAIESNKEANLENLDEMSNQNKELIDNYKYTTITRMRELKIEWGVIADIYVDNWENLRKRWERWKKKKLDVGQT